MRDYHSTPESYLTMMREAVPGYDRLEDETLTATGVGARSVLELGTGTGETARRVLNRHPDAQLIGIDASPGMVKDNDIHLVIKGITTAGTMIVEFPLAPTCTANATTGAKARMKNARNAFGAACGVPGVSTFTKLQGRATIRGIGFFDFLHGQTGVAPNGIELHPVLRFMDATCAVVS